MKQYYFHFLTAVCMLFVSSTAWADDVIVGNLVYTIDTEQNTATVKGPAEGATLGDLTIPATIEVENNYYDVTKIGMDAFKSNTTLTAVDIPASVTKIESHAFQGCSSLATITFHEGEDLQFSRRSFMNCTALTELNLPASYSDQFVTEGEYEGKNGEAAFTNCSALTKVTFANGSKLKKTYNYMFQNCTKLANINLEVCTELTNLAGWMFQSSGLTAVKLPASITVLEQKCFQNCKSLASVDLTACADLVSINTYAFHNNAFTCIDLSHCIKMTNIYANAFEGCALQTIDLSKCTNLLNLWGESFLNNKNLMTVILPKSLKKIFANTFQNDTSLKSVIFLHEAFDWTKTDAVVLNKPEAFDCGGSTIKCYFYKDCTNVPDNMNYTNSSGVTTTVEMVPVAPITIADGLWDTFFTANAAITIPEGLETSIVTTAENGVVTTSPVSGILPKATPVIVKGTAGTYYPEVLPENTDEAPTNLLSGLENTAETTGGDKYYRFGLDTEQTPGFFFANADGAAFTGDANKAYLALNSSTAGTKTAFYLNSIPTGISNISNETSTPTTIYDLQGRRKNNTHAQGVYIINGKKIVTR